MLEINELRVAYGSIEVLHGLNINVASGEIVTIIGSNGAGKSTLLKAIAGSVKKNKGSTITFLGEEISSLAPHEIVAKRISLCPEGRRVFSDLTVHENLEMGAYILHKDKKRVVEMLQKMYSLFPILAGKKKQAGKTLSGGEQQLLAIARAMMSSPQLLMLDEPSTGLAPMIVESIFNTLNNIRVHEGTTILLVEQNAKMALALSDRGYVLKNGTIVLEGDSNSLLNNDEIRNAYLGEKAYN